MDARFSLTRSPLWLLAFGLSAAALLAALASQYLAGLYPCHLCIIQRYPHIAVMVVALLACFIATPRTKRWMVMLCGFLLLANAGIASYHAAVEKDLISGPSSCTMGSSGTMTIEELRTQVMAAPKTFCDEPAFYFMGLTMASLHAIYCAGAACLLFWLLKRRDDHDLSGN